MQFPLQIKYLRLILEINRKISAITVENHGDFVFLVQIFVSIA